MRVAVLNKVGTLSIFLLFFLGSCTTSQSQSVGPLKAIVFSGHLTDPAGASITIATISLEAKEHSILWTTADQAGHFEIEAHPGDYILRVISRGFATYQQSIRFGDAASIEKDIVLQISNLMDDCYVCVPPIPQVELLDASLTSTLPLNPLPPLKLHKHIAR